MWQCCFAIFLLYGTGVRSGWFFSLSLGFFFSLCLGLGLASGDSGDGAVARAPRPAKATLRPSKARLVPALCGAVALAPQSSPSGKLCWRLASPGDAGRWALAWRWGGQHHQ
ncbi:hypothetical protein DQ04_05491000 [Trypanosoma grayi]|uniref:hypothetical protein n=1 Tax=Trypanosoma grayi TaxID=71804 RepID=UPI0004F45B81|nr:hypothetical protein DQ04_05491000 [Trypanosoma grayi]KEG09275.1 hypothetical protein DQ04_05491000 [Trypanosoma grayi]